MAITLTGTGINFPVGTQEKAASGFVLGFTQYWQNMTSNRLLEVTYTNFTGRPIMVFIRMADSGSNALTFYIDGALVATTAHNGGAAGAQVQCIIPTGSTYGNISSGGGAWVLNSWWELRT
jgi:hypothetical protein